MTKRKAKYRIEIVTYESGRQLFYAQFKRSFKWWSLDYYGREAHEGVCLDTREKALEIIDKHFKGNTIVQTIEFEYIDR